MNSNTDLGQGSVGKLLLKLSIPAIAAQLINALYNMVDRMYIGRIEGVGALALTGVGLCFPIIMIISAFSSFVGMGGAPIAAIRMGEKDEEGAEKILGNSVTVLFLLSVILTVFFLLFKEKLLFWFGASNDTIGFANSYLTIYVSGTIFVQFALGLNPFITTQGFSKTGMLTVLIGAILNIVLDPIFIFGFGMGVQGAALATILSQAVSAAWVLLFLLGKKTILRIKAKFLKINFKIMLPVFALGISPFIMQSTESLVNISLNASLQRYGGDMAVGAITIISSIMQFCTMPMMGLTQGAQPIVSYNYGAKMYDRVRKTYHLLIIVMVMFSTLLWASVQLFPQVFIGIFTNDAALSAYTVNYLRIFMAMTLLLGLQFSCQQTFLALGRAKISVILALLRKIILLIPLVFILGRYFGTTGVFVAEPVADAIASLTTFFVFLFQIRRILSDDPQEGANGET